MNPQMLMQFLQMIMGRPDVFRGSSQGGGQQTADTWGLGITPLGAPRGGDIPPGGMQQTGNGLGIGNWRNPNAQAELGMLKQARGTQRNQQNTPWMVDGFRTGGGDPAPTANYTPRTPSGYATRVPINPSSGMEPAYNQDSMYRNQSQMGLLQLLMQSPGNSQYITQPGFGLSGGTFGGSEFGPIVQGGGNPQQMMQPGIGNVGWYTPNQWGMQPQTQNNGAPSSLWGMSPFMQQQGPPQPQFRSSFNFGRR